MLTRKEFIGGLVAGVALQPSRSWGSIVYPAATLRATWQPFDCEPVTYDGVDCCVFVDEIGGGKVTVELVPEDEVEGEQWPVDVLRLPIATQQAILSQLREG